MDRNIFSRWNELVIEYDLINKNIKDPVVQRLVQSSAKNNSTSVKDLANQLFNEIR